MNKIPTQKKNSSSLQKEKQKENSNATQTTTNTDNITAIPATPIILKILETQLQKLQQQEEIEIGFLSSLVTKNNKNEPKPEPFNFSTPTK